MKQMSLLKLRNRIYNDFFVYFRYSKKCNCLYGSFSFVPRDVRKFVESLGFKYSRFFDGATYIEYKD